jgi:hypothetical protein
LRVEQDRSGLAVHLVQLDADAQVGELASQPAKRRLTRSRPTIGRGQDGALAPPTRARASRPPRRGRRDRASDRHRSATARAATRRRTPPVAHAPSASDRC